MVRLADGLDAYNQLSDEAIQRAMDCLTRFGQLLRDMPPGTVRITGTNTLRKARNAARLISHAEQVLGHPIEIISGIEEARLIYLGVAHGLSDTEGQRLVVDIGGGSTELILGQGFNPTYMESLYMGCVSFSKRFFPQGEISRKKIQRARIAALQELEPVVATYKSLGWQQSIGASGTIRSVQKVATTMQLTSEGISITAIDEILDQLGNAKRFEDIDLPGLSTERKPVFPGGLCVLSAVFTALGIEHMQVADTALREGLLYDLLGRNSNEDVRNRTVDSLIKRYQINDDHATNVTTTTLNLLQQVEACWKLPDQNLKQLLYWAAYLHEIGRDISHQSYHKHGAYILYNADMPGFSRQEQQVLACLVRAHRRKFPLEEFEQYPDKQGKLLLRLAILLRLAVVLHRSRNTDDMPSLSIEVAKKNIELVFGHDWLESHTLTQADLEQEAGYLDKTGYRLTFR